MSGTDTVTDADSLLNTGVHAEQLTAIGKSRGGHLLRAISSGMVYRFLRICSEYSACRCALPAQ